MNIDELRRQSTEALLNKDWAALEIASRNILLLLRKENRALDSDLRKVARNYLASIIREGKFLISQDAKGQAYFESEMNNFRNFVVSSPPIFLSTLRPEIRYVQQIQIFLSNPRADSTNKAGSSLRRLGRPDLAIELSTIMLQKTRLNYYALNVRGSAFIDLGRTDDAIVDLEKALQFSPGDKRSFALTSLARALREKFKASGDLEVGERALSYAEESLKIDRNPYIARIFISIVRALGRTDFDETINELIGTMKFEFDLADELALQIADSILKTANSDEIELGEEPHEEFLDDLDDDWLENSWSEEESISDYFEDYFEDYSDSLNNPQMPHLEP